jgi:hypothetical protein
MSWASSDQEGSQSTKGGAGGSGGSGGYTTDFPDSTKGTAVISPPDSASIPMFHFEPTIASDWPDLADREFLIPSLHVGGPSSEAREKLSQNLYERIEQRLREYEGNPEKKGLHGEKNGLAPTNPFSQERELSNGLEKKPTTSGLTF